MKKTESPKKPQETVIYVGPAIPGIVSARSIFNNGLPEELKRLEERKPFLRMFLVSPEKMGFALAEIRKKGSAMNILYEKLKEEK